MNKVYRYAFVFLYFLPESS